MALKGIKVLEFTGLAPGPFCGKILSDFGATVTRVDKIAENPLDCLQNGKKTLALNLKKLEAQKLIKSLCKNYDVLLEPFRPGIMEKLNLGPDVLMKENPKLIYARLTGFGQDGPLASRAGHDINYLAISGVLSFLGRKSEEPLPPVNLLADFAGGGLLCALGICLALLDRYKTNAGQVIDSSMVEGAAYIASWLLMSQNLPIWGKSRGENMLDSGAFYYDVYRTKDNKFMSVGPLETQFYDEFCKGLEITLDQYSSSNDNARKLIQNQFLKKTQAEWSAIFENIDACVYPVLDWKTAHEHHHNKSRQSFTVNKDGKIMPNPSPRLSKSPGKLMDINNENKTDFSTAFEILKSIGKSEEDVKNLIQDRIVLVSDVKGKL